MEPLHCFLRRSLKHVCFFKKDGMPRFCSTNSKEETPKPTITSLQPHLKLFSWSVDSTERAHSGVPRRVPFVKRIPWISEVIQTTGADIVALQDSSESLQDALSQIQKSFPEDPRTFYTYQMVVSSSNGKSGQLQLFVRNDSPWVCKIQPEFSGMVADISAESEKNQLGLSTKISFRLVNVDLAYRGKSLLYDPLSREATHMLGHKLESEKLLATSNVKNDAKIRAMPRPPGSIDKHRNMVLEFLRHVVRADVVLGNVYMSRMESYEGFDDAWIYGGRSRSHERTLNTFRKHHLDYKTNHAYFKYSFSDCIVNQDSSHISNKIEGKNTFNIPEVAGRYQRCFFRSHNSKKSFYHSHKFPFLRRFKQCHFSVLRPFFPSSDKIIVRSKKNDKKSKQVVLGSDNQIDTDNSAEEKEQLEVCTKELLCAPSDQYPIVISLR